MATLTEILKEGECQSFIRTILPQEKIFSETNQFFPVSILYKNNITQGATTLPEGVTLRLCRSFIRTILPYASLPGTGCYRKRVDPL